MQFFTASRAMTEDELFEWKHFMKGWSQKFGIKVLYFTFFQLKLYNKKQMKMVKNT